MKVKIQRLGILLCFLLCLLIAPQVAKAAGPTAVTTFHSIGIYWSPTGGASDKTANVRYRILGASIWSGGHPLWFDSGNSEYRGSLVYLYPGTTYEIELSIAGESTATLQATTWSEEFPIAQTIYLPESSNSTLEISQSGTAEGYILYTHLEDKTSTIDVNNNYDVCINIQANVHHVIIRGLILKGATKHGIKLGSEAHDIVIEKNDISGWGDGTDYQYAVYAHWGDVVERIIIQRNKLHHPRSGSNSWDFGHPEGPQGIGFPDSRGNHVIRYNEIYSEWGHYFNDGMGMGQNFGYEGFPNKDSDIYGNIISHCWDDGIESEGANQNVRIWGNYIDKTYVKIAIAGTSKGPLYIWRNIADTSRGSETESDSDNYGRGPFIKAGAGDGVKYASGRTYVFHNTLLQQDPPPGQTYKLGSAHGISASGGEFYELISRNNIFTIWNSSWSMFSDKTDSCTNDLDYDLYTGWLKNDCSTRPHESHGINSVPTYDPANGEGEYALQSGTNGFDAGVVIPNFSDNFYGTGPDIGAFEANSPPMQFGVNAYECGIPHSDDTPPTIPLNLLATPVSESQIDLTWEAASDPESGVSSYKIYREGAVVGQTTSTSYSDTGLTEGTMYTYEVSAVNCQGLESGLSNQASATTLPDITPPTIVSVEALDDPYKVTIVYSEPVEVSSATTPSNYAINYGISISAALLSADSVTITLTTSKLSPEIPYILTVNYVIDRAVTPNTIAPDTQIAFTFVPVPKVHVGEIFMGIRNVRKKHLAATAQVLVLDSNFVPVANANVTGMWSGLVSDTQTELTGIDGIATFESPKVSNSATGIFVFTVTDVTALDFTYDPESSIEESDCIDNQDNPCTPEPPDEVKNLLVSAVDVEVIPVRKHWRGKASVTVVDEDASANIVAGATVTGYWEFEQATGSITVLGSESADTDGAGKAVLLSPKRRAVSGDIFRFTVTDVTLPGATYVRPDPLPSDSDTVQ